MSCDVPTEDVCWDMLWQVIQKAWFVILVITSKDEEQHHKSPLCEGSPQQHRLLLLELVACHWVRWGKNWWVICWLSDSSTQGHWASIRCFMRMFVEPLISGLCSPRHCRKQYVCVFLVKQDLLVGHRCDSETHAIHERAIHERKANS